MEGVLSAYSKSVETVNRLNGIHRTEEEQIAELADLQAQQEDACRRVNELEAAVRALDKNITGKLDKLLDAESLGLAKRP